MAVRPVIIEPDQVGFLVPHAVEHCPRCGDTNYDDDRICLTCTYPDDPCSRAFLDAVAEANGRSATSDQGDRSSPSEE